MGEDDDRWRESIFTGIWGSCGGSPEHKPGQVIPKQMFRINDKSIYTDYTSLKKMGEDS